MKKLRFKIALSDLQQKGAMESYKRWMRDMIRDAPERKVMVDFKYYDDINPKK